MDNPWITDVGDLDGLVRLSVEFAIDGDFRYGGDAASIGQGLVQTILRTHWDGPIHEFERRAWGQDARVRTDFAFRDLCTELGSLVVESSNLEHTVRNMVLIMLAGGDWGRNELVVDGFSASQMRDRCARLAHKVLAGSLLKDVTSWLHEVSTAQALRNDYVHSQWFGGAAVADGRISPARVSQRVRKPHRGMVRVVSGPTPDEIRDTVGRCSELHLEGLGLYIEIQNLAHPGQGDQSALPPWSREAEAS